MKPSPLHAVVTSAFAGSSLRRMFLKTRFSTAALAYPTSHKLGTTTARHSSSLSATLTQPTRPYYIPQLSSRLDGLEKPTVWHEFSSLAAEYHAINLGQGFPDWNPPSFVVDAMHQSTAVRHANQYARSAAHMPLATVLAEEYTIKLNRDYIDPTTEVATAVGCTQALYCALQGLLNPMDEVILMEPAFDIVSL